MAARLQDGDWPTQDRCDDMESFYHVLNYICARYAQHTLRALRLDVFLHENFEDRQVVDGQSYSLHKADNLLSARPAEYFLNPPLSELLQILARVLATRYQTTPRRPRAPELLVEYDAAMKKLESGRQRLEDPNWLVITLENALKEADWDNNGERVDRDAELRRLAKGRYDRQTFKRSSTTTSSSRPSKSRRTSSQKKHASGSLDTSVETDIEGDQEEPGEEGTMMNVETARGRTGKRAIKPLPNRARGSQA